MHQRPIKAISMAVSLFAVLLSCNSQMQSPVQSQTEGVKTAVLKLMDSVSADVLREGSIAWLNYFEESPDFFMAVDGKIAFPGYDSASSFVKNTLVKQIVKIKFDII